MALSGILAKRGNILANFHAQLDSKHFYEILGGVRWTRRRATTPWFVRQNTAYIQQNLTKKNETFLKEITQEIYDEKKQSAATLLSETSPLKLDGAVVERKLWTPESIRTGLLTKKIGTVPQWTKDGQRFTCTLLQVQDNYVLKYTDPETWYKTSNIGRKYGRRILGRLTLAVNPSDPQQFTAAYRGLFDTTDTGIMPSAKLATFAITPDAKVEPGTRLYATHFKVGQYVTLWGRTIDRGFQGVMKRWGFKGGPDKNSTKWHRRPGSVGTAGNAETDRGKPMPGRMGWEWRPIYGAKVVRINTKYQVLYVRGNMVQGKIGNYIWIRDCGIWHKRVKDPAFPTHYPTESKEPLPDDFYDVNVFNFSDPTITFPEVEEKKAKTVVAGGTKVKKQAKVRK